MLQFFIGVKLFNSYKLVTFILPTNILTILFIKYIGKKNVYSIKNLEVNKETFLKKFKVLLYINIKFKVKRFYINRFIFF